MNWIETIKTKAALLKLEKEMKMNANTTNDPIDNNVSTMGRDYSTATRLLDKNYSPMIVRKYQMEGWPLFVSLICDVSLSDLDDIFYDAVSEFKHVHGLKDDIQVMRNFTGFISEYILNHYNDIKTGCVEGIAVLYYVDKCFISSLYGDFMVHSSCKMELYNIINTLPHI